jgi:hypothetical protein
MGTKMAPSYANIFMGDQEELLLLSSLKQPLSWFRFIEDVDMKWTHGDKELDEFLEHANSIHPSMKFTHEVSKTKMSFLDTTTTVKEGNMTTDLYSKPTEKYKCLGNTIDGNIFNKHNDQEKKTLVKRIFFTCMEFIQFKLLCFNLIL